MYQFENKIALITGANSGIGFETAKLLNRQGAHVIITGRNEKKVKKAARELKVEYKICDVSKLSDISKMYADLAKNKIKIDILFINAGIFIPTPVGQTSEDAFDQVLNTNFKGAFFCIETLLPLLKEEASIICTSSICTKGALPTSSLYTSSKSALEGYVQVAAKELAENNIRINLVSPGTIRTPILGKSGFSDDEVKGFINSMQENIPLKRIGEPKEIAELVAYLASDNSKFITGSNFVIDGGATLNSFL